MRGVNRTLVNPAVSSRDAFAEIDARKAAAHEAAQEAATADDIEFGLADQAALEVDQDRREELARLQRLGPHASGE